MTFLFFRRFLIILTLLACCLPRAVCDDETAVEIMRHFTTRHQLDSYISTSVMLLQNDDGAKEQRTLKVYYKKIDENESRSLYVFEEPVSVKGVAVLTWNHNQKPDDQWLYLPSTQKLRRVAESSKKSYFMGTDITYEDMEPEELDDFTYTLKPSERIDDQDCFVIDAVPATREKQKQSRYSKRTLWIQKDIYFIVKIDYYDQHSRNIKTQTFHDIEHIQDDCWRARKTLIVNHERNHKTAVGIKDEQTNVEIENDVFTERHITSGVQFSSQQP